MTRLTPVDRETLQWLRDPLPPWLISKAVLARLERLQSLGLAEPVFQRMPDGPWHWHATPAGRNLIYPPPAVRPPCRSVATTPEEKSILDHLVTAWGLWCKLPDKHPDDLNEFRFHVHALQNMLAWRVARRADPEVWGAAPPESDR